jgi:hypothetical protein
MMSDHAEQAELSLETTTTEQLNLPLDDNVPEPQEGPTQPEAPSQDRSIDPVDVAAATTSISPYPAICIEFGTSH